MKGLELPKTYFAGVPQGDFIVPNKKPLYAIDARKRKVQIRQNTQSHQSE
jgi:hypothetical protein